jgi:hypothetical protein
MQARRTIWVEFRHKRLNGRKFIRFEFQAKRKMLWWGVKDLLGCFSGRFEVIMDLEVVGELFDYMEI